MAELPKVVRQALCILVAILMVAVLIRPESARGQATSHKNYNNAAIWYSRAYSRYLSTALPQDQLEALWAYEGNPSRGPSDEVRQIMSRLQPTLSLVMRGVQQPMSDFQIDFSQGPFTDTSPFAKFRSLSNLLRDDCLIHLNDGDIMGATARLAGIYRMAGQAGDNNTVVSSLVGTATMSLAERQMQSALEQGAIGPREADTIARSLKMIDADDPFNYVKAIAHERLINTKWLMDRYTGEGGKDRLAEDMQTLPIPEDWARFAERPQSELDAALQAVDNVMSRIVRAFSNPDPEKAKAELAKISAEIKKGDHGPVASNTVMDPTKFFEGHLLARATVHDRLAQMLGIADGSIDPKTFANSARWYIRAIVAIDKLEPESFDAVRRYALQHTESADQALVETLAAPAVQSIIDTLREGSMIKRCDFTFAHGWWPNAIRPYQPGMRDAARLLDADAARLIHAGDLAGAVDRLAIGYRMSGHLASDKQIVSSLVAQASFQTADAIVAAAIDGHLLSDGQIGELWQAAQAISTVDPFGHKAAVAEAREELRPMFAPVQNTHQPRDAPVDLELTRRNNAAFVRCNGDWLLWLAIVADLKGAETKAVNYSDLVSRLDDVLEIETLRQSLAHAPVVQGLITHGDLELVLTDECPIIGHVAKHMSQAMSDVRQCRVRLRPREDPAPR